MSVQEMNEVAVRHFGADYIDIDFHNKVYKISDANSQAVGATPVATLVRVFLDVLAAVQCQFTEVSGVVTLSQVALGFFRAQGSLPNQIHPRQRLDQKRA